MSHRFWFWWPTATDQDRRVTWTAWNWSLYLVLLGVVMLVGALGY